MSSRVIFGFSMDEIKEQKCKRTKKRAIIGDLISFAITFAIILIIHTFCLEKVSVEGSSMVPSLNDGDLLLAEKLSPRFDKIERYDVIYFYPGGDRESRAFIKRVIGLPGETIQIKDSHIYINDMLLEEDYANESVFKPGMAIEPVVLGEDEYFVLGDNRNHSSDSRDPAVGIVKHEYIIGHAFVRLLPLSSLGKLE